MAQGAANVFHAFGGYLRDKVISMPSGAGINWKCALISDPISALLVSENTPELDMSANINEVPAGGGYVAKGIPLTLANTDVGGLITMKLNTTTHPGGKITWTKGVGSPTNIKTAVIFDEDSVTDKCICFIDMTTDGVTPASLVAADVSITFTNDAVAGGILTITS